MEKADFIIIPNVLKDYPKSELKNYCRDSKGQPLAALGPIGQTNIFVGSTNSGKSRLMRLLFNNDQVSIVSQDTSGDDVAECIVRLATQSKNVELAIPVVSGIGMTINVHLWEGSEYVYGHTKYRDIEQVIKLETGVEFGQAERRFGVNREYFVGIMNSIIGYIEVGDDESIDDYINRKIAQGMWLIEAVNGNISNVRTEPPLDPGILGPLREWCEALKKLKRALLSIQLKIRKLSEKMGLCIFLLLGPHIRLLTLRAE